MWGHKKQGCCKRELLAVETEPSEWSWGPLELSRCHVIGKGAQTGNRTDPPSSWGGVPSLPPSQLNMTATDCDSPSLQVDPLAWIIIMSHKPQAQDMGASWILLGNKYKFNKPTIFHKLKSLIDQTCLWLLISTRYIWSLNMPSYSVSSLSTKQDKGSAGHPFSWGNFVECPLEPSIRWWNTAKYPLAPPFTGR